MGNDFARYVHRNMVVMQYELPALPPFSGREIEEALTSGHVKSAPISIHRDEGRMYWSNDTLAETGLSLTAERTVERYCTDGKSTLIGTVENVIANDDLLTDPKTAMMALVYGRHSGLMEEQDFGGVSVFVLREKYQPTVEAL